MLPIGAGCAQRDQVLLHVTSRVASKCEVMNLQVLHAPAGLAPPTITVDDLLAECLVSLNVKLKPRCYGSDVFHEAAVQSGTGIAVFGDWIRTGSSARLS